ncbi:MAG: hypothetical protein QQN63_03390 [Nitrosopumilus sp.]
MTDFMWVVLFLLGIIGAELGLFLVIFGLLTWEVIRPKRNPEGVQPVFIGMPPGMHPGMHPDKKEENGDNKEEKDAPNKGLYV